MIEKVKIYVSSDESDRSSRLCIKTMWHPDPFSFSKEEFETNTPMFINPNLTKLTIFLCILFDIIVCKQSKPAANFIDIFNSEL